MKKIFSLMVVLVLFMSVAVAETTLPETVTIFQTEFFRTTKAQKVIVTSDETTVETGDDGLVTYKCVPIEGVKLSVNFKEDALVSYTVSIDTNESYAENKKVEVCLSFLMAANLNDADAAYAILEYLVTTLKDDGPLGRTSELEQDDILCKLVITPLGGMIVGCYPAE